MRIDKTKQIYLLPLLILLLVAVSMAHAGELPPNPGEAGRRTLAGIDSDHDGVRDDVQRWIALTFPHSEKLRAALIQQAKLSQLYILNASNPDTSRLTARKILSSIDCLSYVSPDAYSNIAEEFDAVFFNTYDRSKALIQADHHSSGTVFGSSSYEDRKWGCDFDPDAMPD